VEDRMDEEKKDNSTMYIIISISAILLLSLAIALPTKQITCYRTVDKTEIESQPYTETEQYIDTDCEYKPLVYSITDFKINSVCLDYNERCLDYTLGICTEKETFCIKQKINFGLKLNNFDDERGIWGVNFNLYLNDVESDLNAQNAFLYPRESTDLSWAFVISGEEECKKEITGSYNIKDEPKKQVCENVIRYREVTKYKNVEVTKQVQEDYKKSVNWLYGEC
jgi:hypothetical protein